MRCCGQERMALRTKSSSRGALKPRAHRVLLEYSGQVELALAGEASGIRYVFAEAGARQLVDVRDAAALLQRRVLRRL